MVKDKTIALLVFIALGILLLRPYVDLFATFGFGESGIPDIKNQDYNQDWMEDNFLLMDLSVINEQIVNTNQQTGGKYDFKLDGYMILIDDKLYKKVDSSGKAFNDPSICGSQDGCASSCITFLSEAWFNQMGYTYPTETWSGGLTGGTHYIEYIIGCNSWTGDTCRSRYFLTTACRSGAVTIEVACPETGCRGPPVPHCEEGHYDEALDKCIYTISDVTYECPEGVDGIVKDDTCIVEGITEIDCDPGEYLDGICYIIPEIIHDCGTAEWDEDEGKCISDEVPEEKEEEEIIAKTSGQVFSVFGDEIPVWVWIILGLFAFIFITRMVKRR